MSLSTTEATVGESKPQKPRVMGRMRCLVEVTEDVMREGKLVQDLVKREFWFEQREDGIHVRRFRARRASERVWPLKHLANGVGNNQMRLF